MKSSRSNIMINNGKRKYFYDSNKELLTIFTLSGEEFNTLNITRPAWENDPEYWDRIINQLDSKDYKMTEKDREEIAEALHNATDWKEARQMKREEEEKKRLEALSSKDQKK